MKQHVQALINGKQWKIESIVQLHELLGTRGERCVHLAHVSIVKFPLLGLSHQFKHALDAAIAVFLPTCVSE